MCVVFGVGGGCGVVVEFVVEFVVDVVVVVPVVAPSGRGGRYRVPPPLSRGSTATGSVDFGKC